MVEPAILKFETLNPLKHVGLEVFPKFSNLW